MASTLLVAGILICAILAIRAQRLLVVSIWMATLSALLSALFFQLGAFQVGVIELSVGTGLIAVLFIFAMALAGEAEVGHRPLVPKLLAGGLVVVLLALLGALVLPLVSVQGSTSDLTLDHLLWKGRVVDLLVQVVLIFAGVLGTLGLLVELRVPDRLARPTPAGIRAPLKRRMPRREV